MNEEEIQVLPLSYHQYAFQYLHKALHEKIHFVLIDKHRLRRRKLFLKKFKPGQLIDSDLAWQFARNLLDEYDNEMRQILSKRSSAFWLHVYRRIGVHLSSDHENKTDAVTLALVRNIAELAIQKHGGLENKREFADSSLISPNIVLGGWMKKGFEKHGSTKAEGKKLFRGYSKLLKQERAIVIRNFGKKDLLGIYEIEGISYQYWRLTALLRSLGKGAKIQLDDEGEWHYLQNAEMGKLIESIDRRNVSQNTFSSLLGVWVDYELLVDVGVERQTRSEENKQDAAVFFPVYNVHRNDSSDFFKLLGAHVPKGSIMNFNPYYFYITNFFEAHAFMKPKFKMRHGFDFQIFLHSLAALSSFSILPQRALYSETKSEREAIVLSSHMQTLTRGYHLFPGTLLDFCHRLKERISMQFHQEYRIEELLGVLNSITLNQQRQGMISLWSGGPKSLIIPGDNMQLLDLTSLPSVLETLFLFMSDRVGTSGTVFERLFRDALTRRGFSVDHGKKYSLTDEERELDAGVLINDCLYLFECVSVERPLDYEIGKPETIKNRVERLRCKIEQAATLQVFFEKNPAGTNYDYSNVQKIEHFVVSPFIEWIWGTDAKLWTESGLPRLISPEEAFTMLNNIN